MMIDNLRRRALVGFAAVAVGFVAGASLPAAASAAENLPAAARVDVALQPNWPGRGHVKTYRDLNYGLVQDKLTYAHGGPPDYCDLPSAGCESYLSN
jgi:hypothetical protein